ncbi:MAG: PspA/IM30 family protein [Alicyclobacillaceae bacterium]|nr:PspA/IM30 family protein [Alicyclobacillaceae bacterium]
MVWFRKLRRQLQAARAKAGAAEDAAASARRQADDLLEALRDEMDRLQVALAEQRRTAEQLRERWESDRRLADRRQEQALAALQQGDDEAARRAVRDGEVLERRAAAAEQLWRQAEDVQRQLADRLERLRLEYLDLQRRRDELVARADLAEWERHLADVQSGIDERAQALERLEALVLQRELQAQAHREVAGFGPEVAEPPDSDIEARLEAVRRQLSEGQ